jgi:hypothetical protein
MDFSNRDPIEFKEKLDIHLLILYSQINPFVLAVEKSQD